MEFHDPAHSGEPSSPKTDEILMGEVQQGSLESFRILYERYSDRIFRYVYHMLGHFEGAEDCVHDVFIQVYNKARYYNPRMRFSPWIYRMARNLTLNLIRKRKGQRTISLHVPAVGEEARETLESLIESEKPNPGEVLESQEVVELLREAMNELSEKDRQVVVLCAIEKLPHKEAAQILGWPVSRVTLQLHRAKARLAKILGRYKLR